MIVDRINAWVLRRLGRNPGQKSVSCTDSQVKWRQADKVISADWAEIKRVVAFQRSSLAGDSFALAFELASGSVIEIDADWDGWDALKVALERHLPKARPFADWLPTLAAGPPGGTVVIYQS